MIQCKRDKEQFLQYVNEHKTYFKNIDDDSYQMIKMLLKSKKWLKTNEEKEQEGEHNMCKALEDLYMDGVKEGIEQGKKQELYSLIIKKHNTGMADEIIADFLEKSVEFVKSVITEEKQRVM